MKGIKEALLSTTLLTSYARQMYPQDLSSHGERLIQLASGPAVNASPGAAFKPAAAGCTDSPVFLTTTGIGTFTSAFSANCTHMTVQVIGAGGRGGFGSGAGGKGGGFGQKNGVAITVGQKFKYQVGRGYYNNSTSNSFFCSGTLNCTVITSSAVIAAGTGGNSGASYNIGDVIFNGGTGGVLNGTRFGGGGGAAGPNGDGAAGTNGDAVNSGAGGQGDNGTGGTGGAGRSTDGPGNPGNPGTEMGSSKGSAGGGGGARGASNAAAAGAVFGGGSGQSGGSAAGGAYPGNGGIKLIPSTFNLIDARLPQYADAGAVRNETFGSAGTVESA